MHRDGLAVRAGHQGQHCRMPPETDLILPIGHGRVKPQRHVLGQHFRVQPPALQIGFDQGRFGFVPWQRRSPSVPQQFPDVGIVLFLRRCDGQWLALRACRVKRHATQSVCHCLQRVRKRPVAQPHQQGKPIWFGTARVADSAARDFHVTEQAEAIVSAMDRASTVPTRTGQRRLQFRA